jgi:hypothetical protein
MEACAACVRRSNGQKRVLVTRHILRPQLLPFALDHPLHCLQALVSLSLSLSLSLTVTLSTRLECSYRCVLLPKQCDD